jgi:hypothetical protein
LLSTLFLLHLQENQLQAVGAPRKAGYLLVMELHANPTRRQVWLSGRKASWILFGISILIGITGLVLQEAPG